MKKILAGLAALAISFSAFASCDQMVPFGYPKTQATVGTVQLCRIQYTVREDTFRKVPLYSAELLLKEDSAGNNTRVNAFKPDPDLPMDQRAELEDYKTVSKTYDRGHMTPFEDTKANSAAALQTFYLSNMVPQNLHLNRGLWRAIENRTRGFAANSKDGVYVITGPIFDGTPTYAGPDHVAIPTRIYKVVIDKDTMQGVAFITPNTTPNPGDTPEKFEFPIRVAEQAAHINFTPTAPSQSFKTVIGKEFQ
jgi:endonuclease G